ncbi:MAG: hypothetical protein FWC72_01235 [Oscillospiraceae bacterium]|nr:hypothetical protein [Oscillospiraceae bacterium]
MSAIKAIFFKQAADFPKNMGVTMMYIIWPVMAFMMAHFMGGEEGMAQVAMFAGMFVGSAPMIAIANTIAEDNEYKGLRFLVMAGVKPWQYLIGLSVFVLIMSALSVAAFVFIGDFAGAQLTRFLIVAALGVLASVVLGGAFGIFARDVQQATTMYTPAMMVLMMLPMLSMFNENIQRVAQFVFSYQVLQAVLNPYVDFSRAIIIIAINIVVLLTFFVVAYKKKGLKG